jgi:hypothetical protein
MEWKQDNYRAGLIKKTAVNLIFCHWCENNMYSRGNTMKKLQQAVKMHGLDEKTMKKIALEYFFELSWRKRNNAIIRYWNKQKKKIE